MTDKEGYIDINEDSSKLITPVLESESVRVLSKEDIESQTYFISERNSKGLYIVPLAKDSVYLNFIAEKIFIKDKFLLKDINSEFDFFLADEIPTTVPPQVNTLVNGIIFRCATGVVLPPENYTYFLYENGKANKIPNFKTLEYLMAERGIDYNSIRVLEQSDCLYVNFDNSSILADKSSLWTPDMKDITNLSVLGELQNNAAAASELAATAQAGIQAQVDAVNKKAEADEAAANAAKAEADAAKVASNAAIAQAQAAQAQAAAAQAAAEAAKAEADAAKAEFESQNNSGN